MDFVFEIIQPIEMCIIISSIQFVLGDILEYPWILQHPVATCEKEITCKLKNSMKILTISYLHLGWPTALGCKVKIDEMRLWII